jgi:bleomycin hydrolase
MKKRLSFIVLLAVAVMAQAQINQLPEGFKLLKQCEATEVKSQDRTGTCWSFSTSSFLESEVLRTQNKHIDLSEMFTVRNIYMEKAINYIRYQGKANFSQGSLAHDVLMSYEKYGMMPESAYNGKNGKEKHNHSDLVKDLKTYLDNMIKTGRIDPEWKGGFVAILDRHLGAVDAVFTYEGKEYNARSFADEVLKLNMDDYVGITSFTHDEYYDDMVVPVPDNFSDGEYYNLPLDEMMEVINQAIVNGYTIEWDGDVSEPGFLRKRGYAVYSEDSSDLANLPEMPQEMAVSPELREAKFDSYETTDDHLMHITGRAENEAGVQFYVVKNSWGDQAGMEGHLLMSEAYMKMKTISIIVHKDAIEESIYNKLED